MDIWADRGSSKECELVIIGDSGGLIHLHRIVPNNKQDSLQVRWRPLANVIVADYICLLQPD